MAIDDVPFQLRPHKFVDRRIFIDFLSHFERWQPLSEYTYVSMGAYALEDHRLIHKRFGINRLVTFDCDREVVERQKFNRPIEKCVCLNYKSGDLIIDFDGILSENLDGTIGGSIVWLDYMDPAELGAQIREFQDLLKTLKEDDILRITINVDASTLDSRPFSRDDPIDEDRRDQRLEKLRIRIGEFLPPNVTEQDVRDAYLPSLICKAFRTAASRALPPMRNLKFSALSIVTYADKRRMLSITGAMTDRNKEEKLKDRIGFKRWEYRSESWNDIKSLKVPDLTLKERIFLEQNVYRRKDYLRKRLGFLIADESDFNAFLDNHKQFYRFYPSFASIEV